jgi:hypothetical protein
VAGLAATAPAAGAAAAEGAAAGAAAVLSAGAAFFSPPPHATIAAATAIPIPNFVIVFMYLSSGSSRLIGPLQPIPSLLILTQLGVH